MITNIQFDRSICGDLGQALRREWLETNGLGGFASSTVIGLNTRRYHGLLVAATTPPVGRYVLLSKLEETLIIDGRRFELSANQYPDVVHPQGQQFLAGFRLDPFPVFTYQVEGATITKSLFMVQGENSTVIRYRIGPAPDARDLRLEVRPLIAFRDYHSTTHENSALNPRVEIALGLARVQPYQGLPALYLAHSGGHCDAQGAWYRNFTYEVERARGLDHVEDLFCPLRLTFDLDAATEVALIASTEPRDAQDAAAYELQERRRRLALAASAPADHAMVRALTTAADQYIVARGSKKTIIAGYHWFSDWGRDTMIALPGLTLVTGRHDVARDLLSSFARFVDRGMLPNRFPDAGEEPEYNTVDATLWFFEAVRAYLAYTGDLEFVRRDLYDVLTDIIAWHVRGTRYGIKVDSTGLLNAGVPGVQLTWMDAKIGDWVVTPRHGKPVEIQALWYNALRTMSSLAQALGHDTARKKYLAMATLAQWSFNRLFWNEAAGCLYDVVNGGPPDASIRPNQVLAVSLHHTMLSPDRARRVVDVVGQELLTPCGLRTLPGSDPRYVAHYGGDARSRDSAYHQGTVWPWLMGPFLTAFLRVHHHHPAALSKAEAWLEQFQHHLLDAGLGQVSEIFDADAPYQPQGCMAQAWSVAEILRAACEDVLRLRLPQTEDSRAAQTAG